MEKHFQVLDKKNERISHQDWTTVVKNKQPNKPNTKKVSQSQQRDIKLMKQVDNDELQHTKIPPELRTKIIQGRASQKLKQKDLAQRCNLPISVINDIESGKAIYNPQHINKIRRVLKI